MKKLKTILKDPVFILRGEDGEIHIIDDPAIVTILDNKIAQMEAQGFDDMAIGAQLLKLVK
jgi:hypothetical protein